jgi:cellulose synthase/poly-beta-1,6-N-acetylglucosamine synthase-like glycosyltransferase
MDTYWRYELWVRKQHSRIDSLFNTTGAIYAMRRSLIRPLPEDTLTDDAALPLQAFFKGYRVIYDPAAIAWDYPTKTGGEFRRRMRTLAGLWQVYGRNPRLWVPWGRMNWHFLSHKFGRLLVPWGLLVAAGATFALPESGFKTFLHVNEVLFLAMAGLAPWMPEGGRLKRLTGAARTFLVINAGALFALLVFVVPFGFWWQSPTKVERTP